MEQSAGAREQPYTAGRVASLTDQSSGSGSWPAGPRQGRPSAGSPPPARLQSKDSRAVAAAVASAQDARCI